MHRFAGRPLVRRVGLANNFSNATTDRDAALTDTEPHPACAIPFNRAGESCRIGDDSYEFAYRQVFAVAGVDEGH